MIESLAKRIGVEFTDQSLLQQAVTHRSFLNENRDYKLDHNERLEFLGDAVLELIVTEYLYKNYANPEGELTAWRSSLVNGEMLASIAKGLGVEDFLMMSKGEAKDTGRARQYLLANAMEAIIGAIYIDHGYDEAKKFVLENVVVKLDEILEKKLYLDPKSYFQEKSQENEKITPSYRVVKEWGPDHDRHFIVGVYLGDELIAKGEGTSKQEAQREAAKNGLDAKGWL
ncbi:MAG: Ribonuclease 3 [Candidatus Moranbacteria bacterium GW2011_GWE1_49_15]|nr:MAG: Ribonuclease 3 [Candidatus Moranbacteria bacterium GW2011_GWE1_49_15]